MYTKEKNNFGRKARKAGGKDDFLKTRKNARREKYVKPPKPAKDERYLQLQKLLKQDGRSMAQIARASGMSSSCISSWVNDRVSRPQGVSLDWVARVYGKKLVLVDIKEKA